jgi:spermidine/putrescine transport system substrate-binding protein
VPNERNLQDSLLNVSFDRGRKFSLPWQSGMTGIGYNRKEVGEVKSIKQLFDPKYKGKVTLLTESRDTLSIVLRMNGIRPRRRRSTRCSRRSRSIERQNRDGQIRRFTGNDYTKDLTSGTSSSPSPTRRHGPAQGRQPRARLRHPRGGRGPLVGQHDVPQGAEQPRTRPRSS